MKTIKHIFTTAFAIAFFVGFTQEKGTQELVVPISNPGEKGALEVNLVNGSIKVSGYKGSEVIIEASESEKDNLFKVGTGNAWTTPAPSGSSGSTKVYPRGTWSSFDNFELSDEKEDNINRSTEGMKKIGSTSFHLTAEEKNNTVVIESDSWQQGIDLEIKVPHNFDLHLTTVNQGEIIVDNIIGMLELENVNGPVTATNIKGAALVSTVNGGIKADFMDINSDSPMSFTTLNGDIEVLLPPSIKATMKMKTDMGEIFTDFDMQVKQQEARVDKKGTKGNYKVELTKWIIGEVNGGGNQFTFQTMSGDFYIRKK